MLEMKGGNVIRVLELEQVGMKWRMMVRCGPQSLLSVSGKMEHRDEKLKVSVGRYDVEVVSWEVSLQGTRKLVAMSSWL
jgi:hypothetical protein